MNQHLKRLLIIAVLVSFIFGSSAQNAASTEGNTSHDAQLESVCDANSKDCKVPKKESKPTKEAVIEEDTTEFEQSTGPPERICIPGTSVCNQPKPDPKPTREAVTDEDASDEEPNTICDPFTGLCQGQYIGDADTVTSPVESSEKDNASNYEVQNICDPITKLCDVPEISSVTPEPTKGDLPIPDISKMKPNPPGNFIVCNPITHKCGQPKRQFFVSESDNAAQIEDSIIQEEQIGINSVCRFNSDGSKTCFDQIPSFGIVQPVNKVA